MERIIVFIVGALPVFELRGAIPLGVFGYGLSPLEAYIFAVLGNFLVVLPLLWFWSHMVHFLAEHIPLVRRLRDWVFDRTRRRHGKKFETFAGLALFLLVAIPLPMTGAWTGTVAAYLFDIPFRKAVLSIGLGILVAGLLVSISVGFFL